MCVSLINELYSQEGSCCEGGHVKDLCFSHCYVPYSQGWIPQLKQDPILLKMKQQE